MDELDRALLNGLQGGFPVCERPYAAVAARFGMTEAELIERLQAMLDGGLLTRFGPLFDAERIGGGLSLCAMEVPAEELPVVAEQINAFPEVAHNYARDHRLNLWFVLATETRARIDEVIAEIERRTARRVLHLPKIEEFFVGLKFDV